jgi:hypothetical protein
MIVATYLADLSCNGWTKLHILRYQVYTDEIAMVDKSPTENDKMYNHGEPLANELL